jgi:uncharacterized protein
VRDRFLAPEAVGAEFDGVHSAAFHRDVPVPMRDGAILRADVWRPAAEGRFPVLLQRLPYSKADPSVAVVQAGLDPVRATEAGFVVVIQDCRGRFASDGEFVPFVHEAADGEDTIAWCAALPFSNGAVGMYGQSYFGATQLLAAAQRPPALRAIAPALTASEYYDGWTYRGGVLELGFVLFWTLFSLAGEDIARRPAPSQASLQAALDRRLSDPWAAFARLPVDDLADLEEVVPYYREWLERAERDPYWRAIAPNERYEQIVVPALHVGGWFDPFLTGTLENFTRLRAEAGSEHARAAQRLVVGPWAHACLGDTIGDVDFGPESSQAATDWTDMHLRWFEQHLRPETAADPAPTIRIFLMGARCWIDAEDWPLPGTRAEEWFLHSGGGANTRHGDGLLAPEPCAADEPFDSFDFDPAAPVPTAGGAAFLPGIFVAGHAGPRDQREVELRPDVLVYTSAPLDADLDIVGTVRVSLSVWSSAPETDFCAKLVDVHPDGRALSVCDGIARAVGPEPSRPVVVEMGATAIRVFAGHRLRLEVSSSNFPRFARNPNSGASRVAARPEDLVVATQRVHHDALRPSSLTLPIRSVPGGSSP